jgi:hypothetical protein
VIILCWLQVEDIEWPFDKQRNARRNFAFIVFEEEDAADRASAFPKQMFGEREVLFSSFSLTLSMCLYEVKSSCLGV